VSDVTQILEKIDSGDEQAADRLLPLVYEELRKLARSRMSAERPDHTLQTTALVHEAYLRLVDRNQVRRWDNSGHFFAAAAEAMRRILVEHARRKLGKLRGGDRVQFELKDAFESPATDPETVLRVSEAVEELAQHDAQIAELVKLHCFAGFTVNEAAEMLGISSSSAYRHWEYARAVMGRILG
jgi:RNA polymerase sigma factor (TIGR02999 family)